MKANPTSATPLGTSNEDPRLQADEALLASELRYRRLFESAKDGILILDAETGMVVDVNPFLVHLLEFSHEAFLGKTIWDLGFFKDIVANQKKFADLQQNEYIRYENKPLKTAHGKRIDVEFVSNVYLVNQHKVIQCNIRDITERKRAEAALRESEDQFRAMFEMASIGMAQADPHTGKWLRVNQKMCSITGYSAAELLQMGVREITHSEDRQQDWEAFQRVVRGEASDYRVEKRYVRKDGSVAWVNVNMTVIRDAAGQPARTMATIEDITERKGLEEQRWAMEAHLRQQQKLESIGTLAGGVAHEINNPINGIMNYAQLIQDRLEKGSPLAEYTGEILLETQRIATIVRNLLTFARNEKASHSPARVEDIVEGTLSLIRTVIRHDQITLRVSVPKDLPDLECRSQQIQQVLMNLMTNARDALNERYPGHDPDKVVSVEVRLFNHQGRSRIRLTVEDHGMGITPGVRERMFDPFFTTKPRDKGTGLGLAISHGIVKEHGGEMVVETEPGRFTRMHVDLPVEKERRNCIMASILIVDDEKSIRRTLGQFLRDDGHEVIEAQDADMALQRLTETEFAVVVTDIILPRMTGVELLRRIRATSPYVQVVMMTGEPTVETASESLRAGATDYLFKPITKEAILRVVDNAVKLKTLEDTKRRLEAENRDHRENLERLVQERARQLRASEERASELARFNQGVLDALTAHICVLAEDGTILAVNRAWDDFKTANPPLAANTGLGANYLAVCEAVVGTDKATAQEAVEGLRALARENSSEFSLEYSCHSPNTQRWFQMRATRFVMEGSTRIVVAHENITKRKRAELRISAFADLRQRLSAVKTQPEALEAIVDAADQLLPWDACSFSLYSPEENKMQHVLSLDTLEGRRVKVNPPESDSPPSPLARLVITTGSQLILKEHPHQMVPGGVPFGDTARPSASLLFAPIRDGSRVIGVMSIQSYDREAYDAEDLQLFEALADVCATALERIQAQMAERDARGLLEQAQKVAHLGSWSRGLSAGAPLFWSSEVYRIFGVSETLSTGKAQDFFARIHPEDRQRVQAASQAALERQLPYDLDHRIVRPDGTVRWVHEKAEIFRDTHGHPLRMVGVVQDITERRQLEEQLRQAQKMETIGQLAGGVAHDFNNVLAAVLLHLGLLQQSNQLSQDTAESLKELQKEALMAVNLTRQLLIFSRRELSHPKPVDLNGLIDNLLKMLRRLLGEHIEVVFQGFSGSVCLEADAGMMEQVVMNLCINSRDAMPKGGRLVLATAPVEISAEASKPESRPGSFVCLSVTDSGCGMDDNVLTHIFEPFYTTKEAGKGTGLGLATVYGIVKQHEGWIEVDSQLGKGSSFRVYLPSLKEPVEKTLPSSQAADMSGGSETVLLVEDEISVRRIAAACLRRLGYAVLEAADGAQALQLWGQHRQRINLLFSDMVMPGEMTGLELAERLWRDKADLKVILSSGYRADMAKPNSIAGHAVSYLDKPYQVAALAKVVRRCLDQPGNDGTQAEP